MVSSRRTSTATLPLVVVEEPGFLRVSFRAMASPCEVLVEHPSVEEARRVGEAVAACAWRIERKFSRYRDDSILHAINTSDGQAVRVDDETSRLLDFAATLYRLSGGLFDITSGVLRRAWTFDGGDKVPAPEQVQALLPLVGWDKVCWEPPDITLIEGMEIDFGGIGKEYAVDVAAAQCRTLTGASCLINFGGDLAVSRPRRRSATWRAGIEMASGDAAPRSIDLRQGAVATSGDARRFVLQNGVRYSHVLDPRSGWPVREAPCSVTVVSDTCAQAGMLATLALLHGTQCETFLADNARTFWVQR